MSIEKLGMPKWGLSMTEGRVIEWLVDEGAEIGVGDEVAEVETEKINGVVEAPVAGVLRRRVAGSGDVIAGRRAAGRDRRRVGRRRGDRRVRGRVRGLVRAGRGRGGRRARARVVDGTPLPAVQGDGGEPLVLLHGFGGDLNNWLFNAEPLSAERAVYALDLPGHGGSVKEARDLVERAAGVPGWRRGSTGLTSPGTRWAAWSPASSRLPSPSGCSPWP